MTDRRRLTRSATGHAKDVGARLLLVEDDDDVRTTLRELLEAEGFVVVEARSGREAEERFEAEPPALVLLDLRLPDGHGFEVCRRLRHGSDVPIIIVTALDDSHDVVAGLEAGADDYVTKPVVGKELSARVRALLRRVQGSTTGRVRYQYGDLEIWPDDALVRRRGEIVHLTTTELRLLAELAAEPGRVLSRTALLDRVWGYDFLGDERLVDAHVRRLRAKLEDDPVNPTRIATVRGLGYKLVP